MDWILRELGYCNVAVWLADENEYQLGAYMKYTIAGEVQLTEAMRDGVLPMAVREGLLHLSAEQAAERLTPNELEYLAGQTVLAVNCTYLGESLAAMVLFRDDKSPFTEDDAAILKSISPIFATLLASIVKGADDSEFSADEGGGLM